MASFRLATRGSTLAMIQAALAAKALSRAYPEHEFLLTPLKTHGDRHPAMRLSQAPREGIFVKELEEALLEGRAELAVHSAKDLPTIETPGLTLAGFLPRADARDALISRQAVDLEGLPRGARIGTGSPRRAAQLGAVRPDLKAVEIRGNVDTRLRRLAEGAVDALVLAAAGLDRLGRLQEAHQLLPFEIMLPAPGQGALVLQALIGSEAARLASAIDDRKTSRAVAAERALLHRLGGGCLSALGAFGWIDGEDLALRAVLLSADGSRVLRASAQGPGDTAVVARVALDLEAQGAGSLLGRATRPAALAGTRVLVTRAEAQAAGLLLALETQGATAVLCPVIAIEPIAVPLERMKQLDRYEWLVLTSANGVDRLLELLRQAEVSLPPHLKVAAIGPETATRCRLAGIEPSLIPARFIAEDLAEALGRVITRGARLLIARAAGSRDVLPKRLSGMGAIVHMLDTYRAVPPPALQERLAAVLPQVDLVTFTSSSTVRHFVGALAGPLPDQIAVACIGPITAASARELGVRVDIIAEEYTTHGLVEAIVRSRAQVSA